MFFAALLLSSVPEKTSLDSESEMIPPTPGPEMEEYNEKEFVNLLRSTYGESRFIVEFCLAHNACFNIVDELRTIGSRTVVVRAAEKYNFVLTRTALKFPKKLTRSTVDTSKWEIEFTNFNEGVTYVMIEELVSCGVLHGKNSQAKVLSLGLGGGFINGYMHAEFPQMKISVVEINERSIEMAKKWFGLKTDERHEVILMDGAKYVEECAQKGEDFDIIFLDACFLNKDVDLICPTAVFLQADVIENIAKLLGNRGILVINVLPNRDDSNDPLKKVSEEALKPFLTVLGIQQITIKCDEQLSRKLGFATAVTIPP
ncbi:hypothetical protein Y032_0008g142 [Ancylostoma ceylanicum]|uniref:Uncharacterized protein n=2 Tax=Ancylostoma ceylanicum TaxID=53326 RepID=A0A016VJV7_9BILA|nr:hypothetical protein Y032_0008g142 [Ancylostoma ceylanicum]